LNYLDNPALEDVKLGVTAGTINLLLSDDKKLFNEVREVVKRNHSQDNDNLHYFKRDGRKGKRVE
jgi:hypothetical protein